MKKKTKIKILQSLHNGTLCDYRERLVKQEIKLYDLRYYINQESKTPELLPDDELIEYLRLKFPHTKAYGEIQYHIYKDLYIYIYTLNNGEMEFYTSDGFIDGVGEDISRETFAEKLWEYIQEMDDN